MRSGKKNCPVAIYAPSETVDPVNNSPVYALTVFKALVWGNAVARRSKETAIEGQVVAQSYQRFTFDYYDANDIDETMVIRYEGVDYAIQNIMADIDMHGEIVIDARAIPTGDERA